MIEDKCCWIREPLSIFYNPEDLKITNYLNEKTKKYTPDFLVRKCKDNSAYLIEIKPKSFVNTEQMQIRKRVIENYLTIKKADWKYKIITEIDIKLDHRKNEIFEKIKTEKKNFRYKLQLIKCDLKYNNVAQKYFSSIPYFKSNDISAEDYKRYVKYGILPELNK
jgi:hypothetical protein